MNKSLLNIIILLVLISIMALFINVLEISPQVKVLSILGIFGIKFLLVAFHFMELKKANSFWKLSLTILIILFFLASFLFKSM
jgi:hypothetical protein